MSNKVDQMQFEYEMMVEYYCTEVKYVHSVVQSMASVAHSYTVQIHMSEARCVRT